MMTRTNGGTKRWILPDYPLVRIMYIMLNCTYYPYHLPPMVIALRFLRHRSQKRFDYVRSNCNYHFLPPEFQRLFCH